MTARIASIATYLNEQRNSFGAAIEPHLDEIEMGFIAVQRLLEKTRIDAKDIDRIIFTSAGIRHVFPSAAAAIADRLNIHCNSFDINAGCTGMNQAIEVASNLNGETLVVCADNLSKTIDENDPTHFALRRFADGAAAVLVSHDLPGHEIIASFGETRAFFHQYYSASDGKIIRELPSDLKKSLSDTYLKSWYEIISKLLQFSDKDSTPKIFCNQGDVKLFEPLVDKLGMNMEDIITTSHGHAGGADALIGLSTHANILGDNAIILTSGVGFHFHGIILGVGQCKV